METLLERGEHDLGALQTGGAGDGVGPQLVHTAAAPCLGVGLCMSAWSDRVHLHLHGAAAGHSVSVWDAMHGSTYRGDEKSDEDADEQRSRRRQLSAQRQRSHGFHRGMLGGDLLANSRGEESSNEGGDGRSGGGRGRERGRERGGGGKSARMCGRRGKSKGTTRCSISTCSSASEQPRNLFPRTFTTSTITVHVSRCIPPRHAGSPSASTIHAYGPERQHAYTQQPSSEQKYPISR